VAEAAAKEAALMVALEAAGLVGPEAGARLAVGLRVEVEGWRYGSLPGRS
jgi:hypothetical protein